MSMPALRHSGPAWLTAAATVLVAWAAPLAAAIAASGPGYWQGVTATTLARPAAASPMTTVLKDGYVWTSLILVLAALGMWLSARSRERARPDRGLRAHLPT